MKTQTTPVLIIVLLFAAYSLTAQEARLPDLTQIQGSFWVHRTNQNSYDLPLDQLEFSSGEEREYLELVFELCRLWFSGVIYGYEFVYVPYDATRQVAEVFEITPIYQIPRGDADLEYMGYHEQQYLIELMFRYHTKDFEQMRMEAWRMSRLPVSSGSAKTPDRTNFASREESFSEAVKQALRNYYTQTIPNKPRSITGRFALFELPRSYANGGYVNTEVRLIIDTIEVEPYAYF